MQFHSFEEAKAFLQKTSPSSSMSLYEHLSDVIQRVLRDPSDRVLEDIETISALVKAERLCPGRLPEGFTFGSTPEIKQARIRAANETLALLSTSDAPEEEPVEPTPAIIADVVAETHLLQWAGIGLGDEQTFMLSLSMERLLARVAGVASMRYFGQFSCLRGAYHVCELQVAEHEPVTDATETRAEAPGHGANAFVYYAMSSQSYGAWTQLPHVLPEQIGICRQKHRFLTGDLQAAVGGYPHFRWNEATYLRAVIARISASTVIVPKGMFELKDEEDGAGPIVVSAEEFQMPSFTELTSSDAWVHRYGALLKQGRIAPFVKPESEEAADADAAPDDSVAKGDQPAEELEEAIGPLRSISEDESASWAFRSWAGSRHPIVVARSLTWPGAMTVVKGKTVISIYVGDGQRRRLQPWQPALPLPFQIEFKDNAEEPVFKFQQDPLPPPVPDPEPAPEAVASEEKAAE